MKSICHPRKSTLTLNNFDLNFLYYTKKTATSFKKEEIKLLTGKKELRF